MRNVLVSFNDYVCDWHVCLSVKFWQKYICSDATRPPLKIGKNFIFPRKTWKIIFPSATRSYIPHLRWRRGLQCPTLIQTFLVPCSPSPLLLIHSQRNTTQTLDKEGQKTSFLFKLGCFNFTPHFFIRFYWWVIESNKSIFSVFQGVSSKRITSNVSFDVFLYLINTIMWFDLTYGKRIIL